MCNGVGRWIHYGIASSFPWKREVAAGLVTYTDPGERVEFDLATGLPLLYEAGLTTGSVGISRSSALSGRRCVDPPSFDSTPKPNSGR
jgi:hypothetical protein